MKTATIDKKPKEISLDDMKNISIDSDNGITEGDACDIRRPDDCD